MGGLDVAGEQGSWYAPSTPAHVGVTLSAVLLIACTVAAVGGARAASPDPVGVQDLYVGSFGHNACAREMSGAMVEELAQSRRFTLAESVTDADAELTGFVSFSQTSGPVTSGPNAMVQLRLRSTGAVAWRYYYRDQRSGAELVSPSSSQLIRTVSQQFSARLHDEATPPSATAAR